LKADPGISLSAKPFPCARRARLGRGNGAVDGRMVVKDGRLADTQ
jgi:hypothetical protein